MYSTGTANEADDSDRAVTDSPSYLEHGQICRAGVGHRHRAEGGGGRTRRLGQRSLVARWAARSVSSVLTQAQVAPSCSQIRVPGAGGSQGRPRPFLVGNVAESSVCSIQSSHESQLLSQNSENKNKVVCSATVDRWMLCGRGGAGEVRDSRSPMAGRPR